MNETWNYESCVSVLEGEIALLKGISAMQDKVRQAVMSREWDDFDEKTRDVDRLGEEFARLEGERARLFSALTGACEKKVSKGSATPGGSWVIEEKPFYAAIMGLPVQERRQLSYLYRELKMETFKMRAMNETFLAYLNEAKTLAAAYIEAVCPARGGKLYTRQGGKVSQDLKSIVFNNRF